MEISCKQMDAMPDSLKGLSLRFTHLLVVSGDRSRLQISEVRQFVHATLAQHWLGHS